jgi:hypothetical protein
VGLSAFFQLMPSTGIIGAAPAYGPPTGDQGASGPARKRTARIKVSRNKSSARRRLRLTHGPFQLPYFLASFGTQKVGKFIDLTR